MICPQCGHEWNVRRYKGERTVTLKKGEGLLVEGWTFGKGDRVTVKE